MKNKSGKNQYWRLLGAFCMLVCSYTYSQTKELTAAKGPGDVYKYVDEMPKSGYDINQYLSKNLHYPEKNSDESIKSKIIISFVVNEDGSISEEKVIRGITKDLDNEALKAVKNMPKWKPGKLKGKPVKVEYTIPIIIDIE